MDIERILKSRSNREARDSEPWKNFYTTKNELIAASIWMLKEPHISFKGLLERSVVISMVTAIEVYFKDMLDLIFKHCDPEFFRPVIKEIHKTRYDINDLIIMHDENVNPLELISSYQSFQNTETIESVFSKFLKSSFWAAALKTRLRVEDRPETECGLEPSDFNNLKALFKLRHELVHNQTASKEIVNDDFVDIMNSAVGAVFVANCLLMQIISKNRHPRYE